MRLLFIYYWVFKTFAISSLWINIFSNITYCNYTRVFKVSFVESFSGWPLKNEMRRESLPFSQKSRTSLILVDKNSFFHDFFPCGKGNSKKKFLSFSHVGREIPQKNSSHIPSLPFAITLIILCSLFIRHHRFKWSRNDVLLVRDVIKTNRSSVFTFTILKHHANKSLSNINIVTDWLIDWLIEWLIDWLIDWLNHTPTRPRVGACGMLATVILNYHLFLG